MAHKAGFVNILGNPNVGKSTLMNAMVGEKLSIITSKSQTTRHRILGIVNSEDYQVVYSDTPGILRPAYKLQESMMRFVEEAFEDADLILYITDVVEKTDKHGKYIEKLQASPVPVLLLINKIDLTNQEGLEKLVAEWHEKLPLAEIIPVSAKNNFHLKEVFEHIIKLLPESPPFYPKDTLTDSKIFQSQ